MSLLDRLRGRRLPDRAPSYRNGAVIQRIVDEEGVDSATATRWFDEMLVFLDLCAASKQMLSPPKDVDKAWHAFLLHSRDYEAYCRERFGRVIHHQPTGAPDPKAYKRAYERRVAYDHRPPDQNVWLLPVATGAASDPPGTPASPGSDSGGFGGLAAGEAGGGQGDGGEVGEALSEAAQDAGGGDSGGGSSCGSSG